jgi:hypothetical protein
VAIEEIAAEEELLQMARQHWQEHRPALFAGLKKMSRLEETLQTAVRQTLEAVEVLIGRGMRPMEAWQVMKEEWILVPEEESSDSWSPETLSSPS